MATRVRWQPFQELASLQSEMARLLNGSLESVIRQSWVPPLDIWETEHEVVYAFDLPGVSEQDLEIEVQDDTLTVTAHRERRTEESDDRYSRYERRFGTFTRSVGLPQGADESKISASFDGGVLEVRVPKPEEAKPRRIELTTNRAPEVEG